MATQANWTELYMNKLAQVGADTLGSAARDLLDFQQFQVGTDNTAGAPNAPDTTLTTGPVTAIGGDSPKAITSANEVAGVLTIVCDLAAVEATVDGNTLYELVILDDDGDVAIHATFDAVLKSNGVPRTFTLTIDYEGNL